MKEALKTLKTKYSDRHKSLKDYKLKITRFIDYYLFYNQINIRIVNDIFND